jgi:predicted  nucleic acid-binding Zn-ribbon protein
MAWFINQYECDDCGYTWEDEWSAMCDDDCPKCGARHMTPHHSIDRTEYIGECNGKFVVYRSSDDAEYDADYKLIAEADTRAEAEELLRSYGKDIDESSIGFGT